MPDPVALAWIGAGAVIASGLIGAGGVLMGVWLTARNEQIRAQAQTVHEDEIWRRDQRRDAYSELIQAADDFRKAGHDLHATPVIQVNTLVPLPSYSARASAFEEASHLLDRAASRANLLGSQSMQPPLHALMLHALRPVSDAAQANPKAPEDAWQLVNDEFFRLYDVVLNAARLDLGFEVLPSPPALVERAPREGDSNR